MNKGTIFLLGSGFLVGFGGVLGGMVLSQKNDEQHPSLDPKSAFVSPATTFPVHPEMEKALAGLVGKSAPGFSTKDHNGRLVSVRAPHVKKPTLLFFIDKECPCCVTAEPFIERLYQHFNTSAQVYGIFNAPQEQAAKWAKANTISFPILVDENLSVIRSYKIQNATSMVLITPGGKVEKAYAGYSRAVLIEIAERLSMSADRTAVRQLFADAPEELATGCSFPPETGK